MCKQEGCIWTVFSIKREMLLQGRAHLLGNNQTPCVRKWSYSTLLSEKHHTKSQSTFTQHLFMNVFKCVWRLLTAARLVVKAGGHEEALLGRSRRQSPLVRRKDRNHQRRELALDLLMKGGEQAGVVEGGEEEMKRKKGGKE